MLVTGANVANSSPLLITWTFSLTLAVLIGMLFLERSTKEEATTIHFMLLLVFPKRKLLFSLSVPGLEVTVSGGVMISVPDITS